MWLACDHRHSDTASTLEPIEFIHDRRSYGDRPGGEDGHFSALAAMAMVLGLEVTNAQASTKRATDASK